MTLPRSPGMLNDVGGLPALLATLHQAQWTGRLCIDMPAAQQAWIDIAVGELRTATCRGFGGMTVLTACALVGTGGYRLTPAMQTIGDQFGLLTPVLLDHLRRAIARVNTAFAEPESPLALDPALGTPLPGTATTPSELIARARLTIRTRDHEPAPAPSTRSDEQMDIAGLVPDDLRAQEWSDAHGAQPTTWKEPIVGQMLGKCYLGERIGEGATAFVYKAMHLSLRLDVAVKVFRPNAAAGHLSVNEGRLLARLSHQHLVRVLDCSEDPPWPHVVLEYVDGSTLSDSIAQHGRMPQALAVTCVLQTSLGLAYAANEGVVHGDVKPANILVSRNGVVKVTDFGVANHGPAPASGGRQVVGTPAYIAPELVRDGLPPSHASDIYALGATLYHALAGAPPLSDPDPLRLMVRQVHDPIPPLIGVVPGLDPGLCSLVMTMLDKVPERRPPYSEVIAVLQRLDRHEPITASVTASRRKAVTFAATWDSLKRMLD